MAGNKVVVETGRRSKAWPGFMRQLASVLDTLAEDQYLVINVKRSGRFVQFAGQGSYGMRAETTSNHYLGKGEKLNRRQVAALKAMGWQPPTGTPRKATPRQDPDGSPNFFAEFSPPVPGKTIASLAVETLAGILGVPHPGMLEYEAFDNNGNCIEFQQLGLKVAVREPTEKDRLRNAANSLLETIREVTGIADLEPDEDGLVVTSYGSACVYVGIIDNLLMAHFFSPLISEVEESPELLKYLNELNRRPPEVRYFLANDIVFAVTDVRIEPFVKANVANAYQHFCQVADDADDLLQAKFGGSTAFVEDLASTMVH